MHVYRRIELLVKAAFSAGVFVCLVGCGDRTTEAPSMPEPTEAVETVEVTPPELSLEEQFAEAIATDPLPPAAANLFYRMLDTVVAEQGRGAALELYREHVVRSPEMADAGYGAISSSFADTNSFPEFLTWINELQALSLNEPLQGRIFANKLEVMVMLGQVGAAQEELLGALKEDAARGEVALGTITRVLSQTSSNEVVLAWTQRLVDSDIPQQYRARALAWHVGTHLRAGAVDPVIERIPQCVALMPEADLRQLLARVFQTWSRSRKHAQVAQALASAKASLKEGHGLADFFFTEELKAMVSSDRWSEASTFFKSNAAEVKSDARQVAFRSLKSGASRLNTWPGLETLSEEVISLFKDDLRLRDDALAAWIQSAREQQKLDLLAERFARGVSLKVNAAVLLREYASSLYAVMSGTPNVVLKELMQVGDAIKQTLVDENDQNQLTTLMFDGAFILEDYDRVMAILETGLPGKDEDWHGMAKNKVLAHKAMKEGDFKAAAQRFRDFMGFVDKTWERPEVDPSTGVKHTREMALGYNAKRIADLLTRAGQAVEAETTYREALGYYEKAIAQAEAGSKEHDLVAAAIRELTQALGANDK